VLNYLKLILLRYFPGFAKRAYRKTREIEDRAYWSSLPSRVSLISAIESDAKKPRLLIVIPPIEDSMAAFGPGAGNYFYEILRSAQDRYGAENVEPHFISTDIPWEQECEKIATEITVRNFSHTLFYIESYEPKSNLWRWDILASELAKGKSGVTAIGFLTDGTYELHQLQCSRFQEVYSNSIFVQIDVAPTDKYIKKGRLFGPTFLPISQESIKLIRDYLTDSNATERFELSFIGKIYGYRKKIIGELTKSGINVFVNPHRTTNSDNQPSYLEYMDALRRSKFTINFARANGTSQMQLKSRMLESALVGTVPLTDDNGLSELVIPAGITYIGFSNPREILKIPELTQGGLDVKTSVNSPSSKELEAIDRIASNQFWECIEQGLLHSDLHLPFRTPLEPKK
jgi:hypothetical protein